MRTRVFPFIAVVLTAAAAARPFTFVVLGDRTGDARPEVFAQILAEVRLLDPDFIVGTGDLIEGYSSDPMVINAEWDTVLGELRSTGLPCYFAPGNHDVADLRSESIFVKRVGPLDRVVRYGNSSFIFFDNSRWPAPESLPAARLKWLDAELARAARSRHTFVFMHRPYWRYALESGRADPMHDLLRKRGTDYVFTGHDHFYCSYRRDSVAYFQVGPSGSRIKVYDDPAQGAFQNYLHVRVSGDTVAVMVRRAGRYDAMPADVVTYEAVRTIDDIKRRALSLTRVAVPQGTQLAGDCEVSIENVTIQPLSGMLFWQDSLTAWRITPREITHNIEPGARVSQRASFTLGDADRLYPLPVCSLHYEYRPGRAVELKQRLPIRRESRLLTLKRRPRLDGKLDDACWQVAAPVRAFGGKSGDGSPVEPAEVWLGTDESLLYIAARVHESQLDELKATVTSRDGKVYDDDHLNIVVAPDRPSVLPDPGVYFQVFVNSLGTVADRRCWMEGKESRKDYSWDGNWSSAAARGDGFWSVELSCPLSDFGNVGPVWSLNAVRLQTRLDDIGVWQVPFEHDPATFGILTR